MSAVSNLKKFIPASAQTWLKPTYRTLQRVNYLIRQNGYRCYCPVCEFKVPAFVPAPSSFADQFKLHGSDLRIEDGETFNWSAYTCPRCGSSDRERLYALYISKRLTSDPGSPFRLLDIAPAAALSRHIRSKFRLSYRTADLFMQGVDDKVDITCMNLYRDKSFDAFICSHVLEHIPNDRKAMSELFRVLKPGGWGIAMVPINLTVKEMREDPSIVSESERWRHFGQGDHVRFYSRAGFVSRLAETGFRVLELGNKFFEKPAMKCAGISESSVLYVVERLDERETSHQNC